MNIDVSDAQVKEPMPISTNPPESNGSYHDGDETEVFFSHCLLSSVSCSISFYEGLYYTSIAAQRSILNLG